LREAVCEQCHLQGEARILRRGRQPFDYRPGLPLELFWSAFVKNPEFADSQKFVSHVQQMHASRCSRDSKGRLGCISCHDPHALPAAAERVAYYRSRCLQCHQESSCSLSPPTRRRESKDDSCVACHMPGRGSSDISHAAATDHRIRRRPDSAGHARQVPGVMLPGVDLLVRFHETRPGLASGEGDRDLGLALAQLARRIPSVQSLFASRALSLLEQAARTWPDDVAVGEAWGFVLALQGHLPEARATYDAVLAQCPERELTLVEAADLATATGQTDAAIGYWRRALAVNPWFSRYHAGLAKVLADRRSWPEAIKEAQAALRLNPADVETRLLLVGCYLRSGNKKQARAEFEKVLALKPPDAEGLRRWFAEQVH
jgi:tetratricopeptide (TPR) repeat protein